MSEEKWRGEVDVSRVSGLHTSPLRFTKELLSAECKTADQASTRPKPVQDRPKFGKKRIISKTPLSVGTSRRPDLRTLEAQLSERCCIVATDGRGCVHKLLSDNDFLQELIQSITELTHF